MREISYENLVTGTLYYIQREKKHGNGKQKGIFVRKHQMSPEDIYYCIFKNVEDISGRSGWINSRSPGLSHSSENYCCVSNAVFYLPEKEEIESRIINKILQKIVGDPYFIFYENINK